MTTARRIRLPLADDWHLHLRDGAMLRAVLPATLAHFGRALIMPNLNPPLISEQQVRAYRRRILQSAANTPVMGTTQTFDCLMTLYLTSDLTPATVESCFRNGLALAVKYYPPGATTHSEWGVRSLREVTATLATMERTGMVLCMHGEVNDPHIDIFDREAVFIERILMPLRRDFPELRIVLEHITTREAVDYIAQADPNLLAGTVTPHHLWWSRNALFEPGFNPHAYCRPILKRKEHQDILCAAVTRPVANLFLGTDSAPHVRSQKEQACGCAGIFNAPTALATCAEVFARHDALHTLEAFVAGRGAAFYRLPRRHDRALEIAERPATSAARVRLPEGGEAVSVFRGGEILPWSVSTIASDNHSPSGTSTSLMPHSVDPALS